MRVAQGSFLNEENVNVSGMDVKEKVLDDLQNIDWPESIAVHIVTVLREIPMNKKTVFAMTEKALRMLRKLPVQDLPAYVYQNLLFASTKPAKVFNTF